jgi:hypothetical protein
MKTNINLKTPSGYLESGTGILLEWADKPVQEYTLRILEFYPRYASIQIQLINVTTGNLFDQEVILDNAKWRLAPVKELEDYLREMVTSAKLSGNIYNHISPLSRFKDTLQLLKDNGHNPIGVTVLMCEDTFIFNTQKEADAAYELMKPDGFFYTKEDILAYEPKYLKNSSSNKLLIYWL